MTRTCLVIPCYNEAERLDRQAFRAFARDEPGTHLIFVDDGSRDATADVLRQLCAEHGDSFTLLRLGTNRGKAEAVRAGMRAAFETGATYCGYWDADLATPLNILPEFRAVLDGRASVDIVLGARVRLLGRTVERRAARHYLGRVFATAASLMLRLPVYDTQCGAKLFRSTSRVRDLFAEPFSSRWLFDVELLARYLDGGPEGDLAEDRLYELPLATWRDVAGSKLGLLHMLRVPLDLWRIQTARRRQAPLVTPKPRPVLASEKEVTLRAAPDRHSAERVPKPAVARTDPGTLDDDPRG